MAKSLAGLLAVLLAGWSSAQEVALLPVDHRYLLLQFDRSVLIVDRTTWRSVQVAEADHIALDQQREVLLVAKSLENAATGLAMYSCQDGGVNLLAQGEVNGTVYDIMWAAPAADDSRARFCIAIMQTIRPKGRWTDVLFVIPGQIGPNDKKPAPLEVAPVPALSGLAHLVLPGAARFSEDQDGWFAGRLLLTTAAQKACPELLYRDDAFLAGLAEAFVITGPKAVRHGWASAPQWKAAGSDRRGFGEVLAFRQGKVVVQSWLGANDEDSYWIIDADSGKMTPCPFLHGIMRARVLSVSQGLDAAVVRCALPVSPGGKESWDVSLVDAAGRNRLITHLDTDVNLAACFVGADVVVTDGSRIWQIARNGEVATRLLTR